MADDSKRLIYVVDDDEAVRRSALFMLKAAGFDVTGWPTGVAFLADAEKLAPGCVLLDVRMPEMDGLEVQKVMVERGLSLPVVMLTGHGDVGIAVQAMKAGAVDFLEKPFEKATLIQAIEAAFSQLQDDSGKRARTEEAERIIGGLTPRERDVLAGLAKGLPNKTIAYDLGISPRTVEVHRANVMSKLEVRSLSDALRIAFAAGLGET